MAFDSPSAMQTALSSFWGGRDSDFVTAIHADGNGAFYLGGFTSSDGWRPLPGDDGPGHLFIAKLSASGERAEYQVRLDVGYSQPDSIGYGEFRAMVVDGMEQPTVAALIGADSGWPAVQAIQPNYGGGESDIGILRLSADGAEVRYATYLGGSGADQIHDLILDDEGSLYLVGATYSEDFPITEGALTTQLTGSAAGFLTKLDAAGELVFSTFISGGLFDEARAVALSEDGGIWIAGSTLSENFPVTPGAAQSSRNGGEDAFLIKISPEGDQILHGSLLGGALMDRPSDLAALADGDILIAGATRSMDFPGAEETATANLNAFLTRMRPDTGEILWSRILGGGLEEEALGLAVNADGTFWLGGRTSSGDFPTQQALRSRSFDYQDEIFISVFGSEGELLRSTYLGGGGGDWPLAVSSHPQGGMVLAGRTQTPSYPPYYPTTGGAAQPNYAGGGSDGFLSWIRDGAGPPANDDFQDAGALSGSSMTVWANNANASSESGEPFHGGPGDNAGSAQRSLWWRWIAPSDGRLKLTTSSLLSGRIEDRMGSDFDTVIAVYTGESLDQLQLRSSNDEDPAGERTSRLSVEVAEGETYYIAVDGTGEDPFGEIVLSLDLSIPPNDDFENRPALMGLPLTIAASNVGATLELSELPKALTPGQNSVWWTWRPEFNGVAQISVRSAAFEPVWQVYRDAASLEDLETLSDFIFEPEDGERFSTVRVEEGADYVLAVDGPYGATGEFEIEIVAGVAPDNDAFDAPRILSEENAADQVSNIGATAELDWPGLEAFGFDQPAGLTLWWTFQPSESKSYLLTTQGSSFNAYPALFTGSELNDLAPVAFDADEESLRNAHNGRVVFEAQAGEMYRIVVDGYYWNAQGGVMLSLLEYAPPKIKPESVSINASGEYQFILEGVPGQSYQIEYSNDLQDWEIMGSIDAASGEAAFTDSSPPASMRFYRAVEQF